MRFRTLVERFQIPAFILHGENLPGSIRPDGFDRGRLGRQNAPDFGTQPKPRRHPVFKYFKGDDSGGGRDLMRFVMVVAFMRMTVPMTVAVMLAAAQQPCARDIHCKTKTSDRDRFRKMNGNRSENTADGITTDQQR